MPRMGARHRIVAIGAAAWTFGWASAAVAQESAAARAEAVRAMTFNVRYGTAEDGDDAWPNRRELVFETVRDFGPDVLGVQEALAFQIDEIGAALPGFAAVGVGRDDGLRAGEFSAIVVDRSRLEVVEHGTFWFSDTPGAPGSTSWGNRIPRICTWARLRDRATARHFYVYNVHWDHESQPSRERSAALLLDRIAGRAHPDDPVLVMGDFNAGEANAAFRALVEAPEIGLRDTFRDVHPDAAEVGTFNGFEGRRDGEKIDAVLASDDWCTRSATIVRSVRNGRYPSDHFPVAAVIERGEPDACG